MRIATARNEMKKPVRTVSIRDGNFRKGDGKFRLYSYKNAGYAERVKTAALHTQLPGSLGTADEKRPGARCVPLGTLQAQLSDLGTMIRKTSA